MRWSGYIFISECPVDTAPVTADENGYLAPEHVGEFSGGGACRGFNLPANHLNIGRWFITLFGLSSVCKCISAGVGGWGGSGRVEGGSSSGSSGGGGGAHTLVVCIMRFPGSSLRCVRDPLWRKPPGMERGGLRGRLQGKRSPVGKIPRCSARLHSAPRPPKLLAGPSLSAGSLRAT